MTCDKCGMPCQGAMCRECERAEHQEDYYGVPSDNYDDEGDADGDAWINQQGLDGETHQGQATLDGGVVKDGGKR